VTARNVASGPHRFAPTRSPSTCFFFQAEDGIRDSSVTGVQTCALPICLALSTTCFSATPYPSGVYASSKSCSTLRTSATFFAARSEERRVGKECRCRWWRAEGGRQGRGGIGKG